MSKIESVDPQTLKAWLDKKEVILIDVRELHEYEARYIPGAKLISLGSIQKSKLPPLRDKRLVLYCGIGKRSWMACEKLLLEDGQLDIYNLEGGIKAWQHSGFAITNSVRSFISLDRQLNIFLSLGLLFGTAFGYFISPLFFLLVVSLAALLLFVGLTGSSLLVMLIASMPWNKHKL